MDYQIDISPRKYTVGSGLLCNYTLFLAPCDGCVWNVLGADVSHEEVEKNAKEYGIDYETAMKWKDYWLDLYKISNNNYKF